MNPQKLYGMRIKITLFLIGAFMIYSRCCHASFIGLHPPELDVLREDIMWLPGERAREEEEQSLKELEKERKDRKEREETYSKESDLEEYYLQWWKWGGG